jgi:hypothetical protein
MVKEQKGPSSFIEWAIGTTTENAIRSINAAAAAAAKNQPKPPPPPHREVLRFRVSTDDDTAEDTLCITYPRTSGERSRSNDDVGVDVGSAIGAAAIASAPDNKKKKKNRSKKKSPVAEMTSTKKVRFEENAPRKSSMKTETKKKKKKERKEEKITVVEEEVATSESEGEEGSGTDFSSDATIVSPDHVQVSSVDKSNKKKKKTKRTKQRGDSETSGSESESGHVVCNCSDCIQERRQERKKHGM